MRLKKSLYLVVASLLFSMITSPASKAETQNDAFDLRHKETTAGEYYFTILDPEGLPYSSLALQPPGVEIGGKRGEWKNCTSPNDPVCLENPSARTGFLALGLCENSIDEDCIVDVQISRAGSPYQSATFMRRLESNLTFEADVGTDFPGGSTASVWQEPGDPSKKYLILVSYGGGFWREKFALNSISFNIIPIREATGNYQAARIDKDRDPCCRITWGSDYRALFTEDGRAGFRVNFDKDVSFKLITRVRKNVSGWYKGRVKDPAISITSFSNTNDLVEVSGEPVSVAVLGVKRKVSEMSPLEYNWLQNNGSANGTSPTRPDARDIFQYIDNFRANSKDTAMGTTTAWSIGSTTWGNQNSCLNDSSRLLGIVSTNAMGFDGNSPKFVDGALEYRVSSLHYAPDGKTPIQGTYNLLLRSDVARCLYGFSNAPVSASISVVGESGNAMTTVSSMVERDGWLRFGVYGFTFSEKTIRVVLNQESAKKDVVTEKSGNESGKEVTAASVPARQESKSLVCIKGKKTKKALNGSKCPQGFKKSMKRQSKK